MAAKSIGFQDTYSLITYQKLVEIGGGKQKLLSGNQQFSKSVIFFLVKNQVFTQHRAMKWHKNQ